MNVVDKKIQVCGRLYNMTPAAAKDCFQRFQRCLFVLCAERILQDITVLQAGVQLGRLGYILFDRPTSAAIRQVSSQHLCLSAGCMLEL